MDLTPYLAPAYAEMAFDGDHCAHCAAWLEERRLRRIIERQLRFLMDNPANVGKPAYSRLHHI